MDFTYQLIRSSRRTMSVEVRPDQTVIVRIPYRVSNGEAKLFVNDHRRWISAQISAMKLRQQNHPLKDWNAVMDETLDSIRGEGGRSFMRQLKETADRMGVSYNRVVIKNQKTRWGSCSIKKNLNFSWKIFAMPEELRRYVMVHELAHLKEMNHSSGFWALVEKELPDYRQLRKKLQEYS